MSQLLACGADNERSMAERTVRCAEMAGVGIFFQQEPTTGRVYVANIVERGSADRSGVIRVNDVIVKIDDEDVQGQPLSTLRNLILGKQGTYVTLAFRRF